MFGLEKGKIEIQLNKFQFSPGETVSRTIALKMNKPLKAKELTVRVCGEQLTTQGAGITIGNARSTSSTSKSYIFDFKQPVDGEKEYQPSEQPMVYPFKITIPTDVFTKPKVLEGNLGKMMEAAQFISGSRTRISWFVEAKLEVGLLGDISKKVQINVV